MHGRKNIKLQQERFSYWGVIDRRMPAALWDPDADNLIMVKFISNMNTLFVYAGVLLRLINGLIN